MSGWTADPPTANGYYWLRTDGRTDIVRVFGDARTGPLLWAPDRPAAHGLPVIPGGEWCGPLEPPEPPTTSSSAGASTS